MSYTEDGRTRFALPASGESALPLELPEVESYLPSGTGESPLANVTEWVEIWFDGLTGAAVPAAQAQTAATTGCAARRETNTMPQWAGSCWYYLRFTDPRNDSGLRLARRPCATWGVPDLYVGGAEHAVLHLLYARFWHKVLFDLGARRRRASPSPSFFTRASSSGEDGEKCPRAAATSSIPTPSSPATAPTRLRLYLMFLGPLEAMKPWNPRGIEGAHRFLQKVWRECIGADGELNPKMAEEAAESPELTGLWHETIRKVGDDIEGLRFNTAISQMMIFANALQKEPLVRRATAMGFLQLLAPFAPHLAEELWQRLGGKPPVQQTPWPAFDPKRAAGVGQKLVIQINGRFRGDLVVSEGLSEADALAMARAHPKAGPHLDGLKIRRVIYIPGKIINLVVD